MMKKLTLMVLCCAALTATAQEVSISDHARLLEGTQGRAYYPVLNASGDRLLFSDGNSGALKMYDFNDNVTTTVTGGFVAGGDAVFGGDGNIYYVTQQVGADRLVYRTARSYDISAKTSTALTEPTHGAMRPMASTRSAAVKAPKRLHAASNDLGTAVYVDGSTLNIVKDGTTSTFSPVASQAGYLWASLSPDGTKTAFFAAGKGIVVTDLNGNVLAMLGNYEMPCWLNNNYIVAQNARDNGHQILSSQLMLLRADGTWQQELTPATSMAMQPTAANGKVVYSTIDGLLYQMNVTVKE